MVSMDDRRRLVESLADFARDAVGGRAVVEVEEIRSPHGDDFLQLSIRPDDPDAIWIGVIADQDGMILDVRGCRGWEPAYDVEGIAFIRDVIAGAVRGEVPPEFLRPRRSYPAI
jgi:hypothetical protein